MVALPQVPFCCFRLFSQFSAGEMFCNSFGLEETNGLGERQEAVLGNRKRIQRSRGGEGNWREENGGTGSNAKGGVKEDGVCVAK